MAPAVDRQQTGRDHYDCETTVAISPTGRSRSEADALSCALGYHCGTYVSKCPVRFADLKMGTMLIGKASYTSSRGDPVSASGA